jgi:hypothetical protein
MSRIPLFDSAGVTLPIDISDVTDLQDTLDDKLESPIDISDVTDLQDTLDDKLESPIAISDVTNLQTSLDAKSNLKSLQALTTLTINLNTYPDKIFKVTLDSNEVVAFTNFPTNEPKSFLITATNEDRTFTIPDNTSYVVKGDRAIVVAVGTWCEMNVLYDGTLFYVHYVNGLSVGGA